MHSRVAPGRCAGKPIVQVDHGGGVLEIADHTAGGDAGRLETQEIQRLVRRKTKRSYEIKTTSPQGASELLGCVKRRFD